MLTVSRIVITGATVYAEQDFAPLYADLVGREVPLAALYELARRITAKYGAAGYVLSRAIVPPQNFGRHGAVVRIQVVEGYVDNVIWPGRSSRATATSSTTTPRASSPTGRPISARSSAICCLRTTCRA